ncbi:MAG: 2OG-Fe(II) oxygenase [Moraxellaceae bacterium]|nr:2OG-Fe(II) oxygenase [Moraxellaceae bacterium]
MIEIDKHWIGWLKHYVRENTSPELLHTAMTSLGFDDATAGYLVAKAVSRGAADVPIASRPVVPAWPFHDGYGADYVNDIFPVPAGDRIDVGNREVEVLQRFDKPCVISFANVLSDEECAAVIERARPRLTPSTVIDTVTGKSVADPIRISEGCLLRRGEDELVSQLEARIARLLNWPVENGEGFAILRYGVGDQYRPHFDYFPLQNPGSYRRMALGGQRFSTLILYLNDVAAGGETDFPDAGIRVTPRKGGALYFQYCNAAGHVDPLSRHAGMPVTAGEKWIMTKWSRQRRFGE